MSEIRNSCRICLFDTDQHTPDQTAKMFGDKSLAEREELTRYVAARLDEIAIEVERGHGRSPLPKGNKQLTFLNEIE